MIRSQRYLKKNKMRELVTVLYTKSKAGLAKHFDGMAALLEQLHSMDAKMEDSITVRTLVASIDMPDLKSVVAAIDTLVDADTT